MLPYDAEHKLRARELRKNMTDAEQVLWKRLRCKQILGVPFYRQKPLSHYIVDFYCPAAMLVIELDGSQHYTPDALQYDVVRTQTLETMGLRVLRFDNRQVLQELESVLEVIHVKVTERLPPLQKGGVKMLVRKAPRVRQPFMKVAPRHPPTLKERRPRMTTLSKSKHPKIRHRTVVLALIAMGLTLPLAANAASQRHALLVGVGEYADKQAPKLKLEGPPNDAQAMAEALKKWGFDRVTVLQDDKATRAAILTALDDLVRDAKPGDHVLFYFSGHGTSSEDPKAGAGLALPHTAGALVPYDAKREGAAAAQRKSLIIGRDDLRPRFEKLDDKKAHLTAWIDACFSENSTHSLAGLTPRAAPGFDPGSFGSGSVGYQPYPYQNAVTFAASAANQSATDIDRKTIQQFPTADGRPHGAFTDALLRALNDRRLPEYGPLDKNGDGVITVDEFATGVTSFIASRPYGHQPKLQPQSVEDGRQSRSQPLFVADQRPQTATPAPAPAKPDSVPPASPTLPEPQRRQQLLDRIASTAQQTGRATVGLELTDPNATSRLPIGDAAHCIKVNLAYNADQKGYPLVVDRFSDGTVQWLYPLAGADDRQRKGQWQQPVPAGQAQTLWAAQTAPPAGVDTVYTLLLDQPLPPEAITSTYQITPTDGARFDLLLDALAKVRVLGAHRLALEIYQPQPGELQSWPKKETCE